nr:DUF645 family protein [Vibrio mimicus]
MLSLSRTLNRGQLNLECFEFWQPTSQLWRWPCVCLMLLRKMTFKKMCLKIIVKQWATKLTNASRGTVNAWRFQSQ